MRYSKNVLLSLAVILCLCLSFSSAQDYPMPESVKTYLATRVMRYHHYMWHQIRDNWNRFTDETKQEFRDIGWEPPNPSRDSDGVRIQDNLSGEDFLYMHRQMIVTTRQISNFLNEPTSFLEGWETIPAPDDEEYPVPPPFTRNEDENYLAEYKTDARYETMKRQEERLKDPNRLRRMTLSQLGLEIESGGIHSALHYRWTNESSVGYRTGGVVSTQTPNISKQWDDVQYDWMGDSYASHVYPLFWKLHGWIDDRIEDWRIANNLTSIRWNGTWTGGPMSNLGSIARKEGDMYGMDMEMEESPSGVGDIMEKAFQIFRKSGVPEFTMMDGDRIDSRMRKIREMQKRRKVRKVCKKKRTLSQSRV